MADKQDIIDITSEPGFFGTPYRETEQGMPTPARHHNESDILDMTLYDSRKLAAWRQEPDAIKPLTLRQWVGAASLFLYVQMAHIPDHGRNAVRMARAKLGL